MDSQIRNGIQIHSSNHKNFASTPPSTFLENVMELGRFILDILCKLLAILFYPIGECLAFLRRIARVDPVKLGRLEGKVVLITGASSGIGEGLAKYFYLAGCKVILAARRGNELERVRGELMTLKRDDGPLYTPTVLQLDISELGSIPKKIGTLVEPVDILINNAGALNEGTMLETPLDVDEQIMRTNYFGSLALTKLLVRSWMEGKRSGQVVFISSILGKITMTNCLSYSASKHAMEAMADCLRLEVPEVKVTLISPGYVKTPISANALTPDGEGLGIFQNEIDKGFEVDYVCRRMFKAVVNEEGELVIAQWLYRGSVYLRQLWPWAYFFMGRIYARVMLNGVTNKAKQ